MEQQNQEREALLCFTVNSVMAPFSGGNNQIFDSEEVNEYVDFYQRSKENIGMDTENNRNNDEGVKNAWQVMNRRELEEYVLSAFLSNRQSNVFCLKSASMITVIASNHLIPEPSKSRREGRRSCRALEG